MYCTNCGAEVSPDQKFCNKCGAPVMVTAINVGAPTEQMPAGTAPVIDNTGAPVQFNPNYSAPPVAPKKSKVWPVVAIVIAALLVISVGTGIAIKKAYDYFKTAFDYAEEIENIDDMDDLDDLLGDLEDEYDIDLDELPRDSSSWGKYLGEDQQEFFEDFLGEELDGAYKDYEYAYATYFDNYVYISGKGVIDDSSILYSGSTKTVGEFCDYIDEEVLDDGYEIDRDLFYELLELHLVDSELVDNQVDYFEQSMMYCLTFASEFSDLDMDVYYCMYDADEPTTYFYGVNAYDEEDTWIVDYSEKFLYMNDGDTEYDSEGEYGMFSDDTLSLWLFAIDEFYGIE
ncbi:zinc ribbon domain-containing protein [Butyrivibrio sp. CB08]|uniref:zinc ribbon domain-containing protein n=1 Tax=Butyrivibrio sp. CB08 TaxID=2364879 RepID=UPI001314EE24|nr:zinc ribbon domain-containing protein [Butyrivibrio sp. CB08]